MINNYRLCAGNCCCSSFRFFDIYEVRSITIRGIKSARSRVKRVHVFCEYVLCTVQIDHIVAISHFIVMIFLTRKKYIAFTWLVDAVHHGCYIHFNVHLFFLRYTHIAYRPRHFNVIACCCLL